MPPMVQECRWVPVSKDHALHADGMRWARLDESGEPEMFASHEPEQIVIGMCMAAGLPVKCLAGNN